MAVLDHYCGGMGLDTYEHCTLGRLCQKSREVDEEMTAPELKPCPFCGGNASYNVTSDEGQQNDYDTVGCSACPAEMRIILHWADDDGKNKADLLSAWNRRADLAQPAQVRVKPLVWVERANTTITSNAYRIGRSYGQGPEPFMVSHGSNIIGWSDSEDGCKRVADQHNRVLTLAALEPQPDPRDEVIARLVGALEGWVNIACHCNITDGSCCCGDDMENHAEPMNCGHVPVDHGSYVADEMLKTTSAALAAAKAVQHG